MLNLTFDATTMHLCYQSFCLVCVRYSVFVIISQKEALVPFSSVAFTNWRHSDENKPIRIWGLIDGECVQTHSYGFREFCTNVLCTIERSNKDKNTYTATLTDACTCTHTKVKQRHHWQMRRLYLFRYGRSYFLCTWGCAVNSFFFCLFCLSVLGVAQKTKATE